MVESDGDGTREPFPTRLAVAGTRFYVTDSGNHRVMVWNRIPEAFVPADIVLGQPHFFSNLPAAGETGMTDPRGVAASREGGDVLVVADTGNHRLLVWLSLPTLTHQAPDLVLGQADFSGTSPGLGPDRLNTPADVWTDGQRIVVADAGNHRLLVWSRLPARSGEDADFVVGQPDFTTATPATSRTGLRDPRGFHSNGLQLFVADAGNRRVLVYESLPVANQPAADLVLGQSDFDSSEAGITAQLFAGPEDVAIAGGQLVVTDTAASRLLTFTGD